MILDIRKKLLHKNSIKPFIKTFLLVFFISSFVFLFKVGNIFFEGGIYLAYLKSMMTDLDFNIINNVPAPMGWLVTKMYFHPDFHSEIQTPLLFIFYLLEAFLNLFLPKVSFEVNNFQLAAIAMNIFLIYIGYEISKKALDEIKIKLSGYQFLFFFGSTVFLYYTLFYATVIEIFSFPLLAYLVLVFFKIKKNHLDFSPLAFGLTLASLLTIKITYLPILLYVLTIYLVRIIKNNKTKTLLPFFVGFLGIIFCYISNMFIKYGNFVFPYSASKYFLDYSLGNIISSLINGHFMPRGTFFINIPFFIGAVGFLYFLYEKFRQKKFNIWDLLFLGTWLFLGLFQTILIIGDRPDDHVPGRLNLTVSILLILGLSFLISKIKKQHKKLLFIPGFLIFFWHIFFMGSFLLIYIHNVYDYSFMTIPTLEIIEKSTNYLQTFYANNFIGFKEHFFHIFFFSAIISFLFLLLSQIKNTGRLLSGLIVTCGVIFVIMSRLNYEYYKDNISLHTKQGFYQNVVIGDGPEIFFMDYVLDFTKNYQSIYDNETKEKLNTMLERFYKAVKKQVLLSTKDFDKVIKERDPNHSFWFKL